MNAQTLRKIELAVLIAVLTAVVVAAVAYAAPRIGGPGGWMGPMPTMMNGSMMGGAAAEKMMISGGASGSDPQKMVSGDMADHMRAMGIDSATIEKMTELMNSADGKRMAEECSNLMGGTGGHTKGMSGMMGTF